MIFSVFILVFVGLIAYFHWLQGLFSATLSAVIAAVAALLAVSFHEPLVAMLLGGRLAGQAHAVGLVAIFAGVYLLLRVLFDMVIPGGMQFPAVVDKVGGATMGVIAGIFATGILALAAQAMPFGPSLLGYSLYEVEDGGDEITVRTENNNFRETYLENVMRQDTFDPAQRQSLILPVDEMLLAMVKRQSAGGALAGSQPFSAIHPDYLLELFGTRIGIEAGGTRVAMETDTRNQMDVEGIYLVGALPAIDSELDTIRKRQVKSPIAAASDEMFLVVRVMFDLNAADKDNVVRFSPGSIRLMTNGHNYFPEGTVDDARLVYSHKVDDFLFVDVAEASKGADLLFRVKKSDLTAATRDNQQVVALPPGAFVEFKRMTRELVEGPVKGNLTASPDVKVLRKPQIAPRADAALGVQPPKQ